MQQSLSQPFAARVLQGYSGRGDVIKVPSVTDAILAISSSLQLVGEQVPFKKGEDYALSLKRMLGGMWQDDAPPIPQLVVPGNSI